MKYLFWNTYKNKAINQILSELIVENDISVVVLAEYEANIEELIENLNICGLIMKPAIAVGCERINILVRKNIHIEQLQQLDYATLQLIDDSIILCGIHLNSQMFSGHERIRERRMQRIIHDVVEAEMSNHLTSSIIVGDFNVNPYDESCTNPMCFYALPIYEETKRKYRIVDGEKYSMFYNPMWNFLGDFNRPYGTFYYSKNAINTCWSIFDQVIIRPDLRERFVNSSLKILTSTERTSLLDSKGHPNTDISDHLPLTFEITEN